MGGDVKPVTVPFFISHQGCPQTCVYCDQRLISGSSGRFPTSEEIVDKVEIWRLTAGERPLEVAFFGGSFTALTEKWQAELLAPLQSLLGNGTIRSVRISTRPDCIDDSCVAWLAQMGVRTVELGVQSMNDSVLSASGRGHTAAESEDAIRCVRKQGLKVGAQLMPGLPADTPASSLASLERVLSAGVDFIRIYPTVVLRGTELARRFADGDYVPLSREQGVSLCKILLHRAMKAGVDVIRIGLQADDGLNTDTVLAGCWHPSLGQLVRSELYADIVQRFVSPGQKVTLHCHPARLSDVVGVKRCNLMSQARRGVQMRVVTDQNLTQEELRIQTEDKSNTYSIINDLNYSIHEV